MFDARAHKAQGSAAVVRMSRRAHTTEMALRDE